MRETFFFTHYHSPLGIYLLASSERGVVCVKTEERSDISLSRWEREGMELKEDAKPNLGLISELDAYFAGKLHKFTVPLDLRGTSFQCQVWNLLSGIPWGETRSYGQIAQALDRPKAARAVGRAVGTNPVSIVVPCHRVVGSDGSLTGYGGGLDRKVALLKLEGLAMTRLG
jgi:methylated-DNA-[protein]-cysteine S-methyltransferase